LERIIVNLLHIITLGFFILWAKARRLQYLYGETSLEGDTALHFMALEKKCLKAFKSHCIILLGIM
jgi:uncharacterized membrane protein YjgN (DUF898 family)